MNTSCLLKTCFKSNFLYLLIALITIGINGLAQTIPKKNILDYYLSLPVQYFSCEDAVTADAAYRKSITSIQDLQNAYILARVEGMQLEVAMFKDKVKGRDIIAVFEEAGPGGMCTKRAFIVQQSDGSWKDVWEEICPSEDEIFKQLGMPASSDIFIDYVIPQFGTTIKLINYDTNEHFGNLKWVNGKFEVSK